MWASGLLVPRVPLCLFLFVMSVTLCFYPGRPPATRWRGLEGPFRAPCTGRPYLYPCFCALFPLFCSRVPYLRLIPFTSTLSLSEAYFPLCALHWLSLAPSAPSSTCPLLCRFLLFFIGGLPASLLFWLLWFGSFFFFYPPSCMHTGHGNTGPVLLRLLSCLFPWFSRPRGAFLVVFPGHARRAPPPCVARSAILAAPRPL